MTGLAAITGTSETPPIPVGTAVIDQHGAALLAMGVLAALYRRERTGEGEHVQVTMARAALDLQLESMSYQLNGFEVERSPDGLGSGFHQAPYGIYPTADGHIALSLSPLQRLARATACPDLQHYLNVRDPWEKKQEIASLLRKILIEKSTADWVRIMREHEVWVQKVNSYAETINDPAITSLDPFESCNDERVGTVRYLRFPVSFSHRNSQTRRFPARLGEHTREVLEMLGMNDAEIGRLVDDGVVYAGD